MGYALNVELTKLQFQPRKNKLTLKLKIGDEEITESGELFSEATFIS